jgi:hypothetical protein
MMTSSSLTELRQAALALWKHQRQDLERTAARQAAERALDLFGDQAGPLGDPDSWEGNADGDAVALLALDDDGQDKLEFDRTFGEQLWLRSDCPACGGSGSRITPIGSLLELGQALDGLQEARGGTGEEDAEEVSAEADGEVPEGDVSEVDVSEVEAGGAAGAQVEAEVDPDDLPGACDDCDEAGSPAQRLYRAVLDVIEAAGEDEEEDEEEEEAEVFTEGRARGRG